MPNMTPKKSIKKYTGKGKPTFNKKTGAVEVEYKSSGGRITTPKVYTGKGKPTFNKKTGAVQIKYPGANIVGTK
jgi:hypothetical protein